MSKKKLPSLSTPPSSTNKGLDKWLNDVKVIIENTDITSVQADVAATKKQLADIAASGVGTPIPGPPGPPGPPGQTSYFHVAYADSADGSVNFNQSSGIYIGTYVDYNQTDSQLYTDYQWKKFEGTDGIPGTNGVDGKTSYLHLKYSNDGVNFTPDTGNGIGEDPGSWLGQYVDFIQADSTVFSDYVWKKIEGPQGVPGPTGYTWIRYADDNIGTGISNNPTGKAYIGFAYNKSTQTESNIPSDYTWSLIKGTDGVPGAPGADGQTTYTWIQYSDDSFNNVTTMYQTPTASTQSIGIAVNKTTQTESNVVTDYTWSKFKGDIGPQGNQGTPAYFYTAYGDDSSGANFSLTYSGQKYMGTYTSSNATQSTNPADYTWVLIKGADGAGLPPSSVVGAALTGLTGVASRSYVILTWNAIPTSNEAQYTIIYRNSVNDPNTAVEIGTSDTLVYADYIQSQGTYYYWVATQSRGSVNNPDGLPGAKSSVFSVTIQPSIDASNISQFVNPNAISDSQIANVDFNTVTGANKPENNATYGATFGSNISGQITSGNAANYVAVGALGADFIGVANLAAINADMGNITAGTMTNADNTFKIDLINKFIEISGVNGSASDDYIRIENGKIIQQIWTGATHQLAQSLNTIEVGTASNGATVTLSKYYATQPKILVTPYDTPIYNAAQSSQDQSIQIRAENIVENPAGSGTWQFDAVSRLVISSGNNVTSINYTVGPSSSGTLTSPVYTTQANTQDITVSVDLTSVRGSGTASTYKYRNVSWAIYYRASGSTGAYTAVSAGTTAVGATFNPVTDTQLVTFPGAGTWEFYVQASYSDAAGTFTSGTSSTQTITKTAVDATTQINKSYHDPFNGVNASDAGSASPVLGSYSPTPGWEMISVEYTWNYGYYMYLDAFQNSRATGLISATGISNISGDTGTGFTEHDVTLGYSSANQNISKSSGIINTSNYNQFYVKGNISSIANITPSAYDTVNINIILKLTNVKATITERQLTSTTASNTLKVNSYSSTLSGATQLSAGTLQWQAIL